jgi:hypothetical protein
LYEDWGKYLYEDWCDIYMRTGVNICMKTGVNICMRLTTKMGIWLRMETRIMKRFSKSASFAAIPGPKIFGAMSLLRAITRVWITKGYW